ncbi:MAG: hypothetical protein ACSHX0_00940 [Akkermansiaceae bacterium]
MINKHWLSDLPSGKESSGWFCVLGWGAFLGTSWTWVIGMVLPALLVRDMGIAGFFAFALPNCIGAAAMGTVLCSKKARELPKTHTGMILVFSIVTVAYHFYIAGYLLPNLLGPISLVLFCLAGLVASAFVLKWKDKGAIVFSLIAWAVSITCFLVSICIPSAAPFSIFKETPLLDSNYTWFFLPASIGGFLLCPYLDATFIRARARTERVSGALAFKIGFLIFFASMIVFTTAYGHELVTAFGGEKNRLTGVWSIILLIHIPLQMGLTVAWHCREIFAAVHHGFIERTKTLENADCKQCATLSKNFLRSGLIGVIGGCALLFFGIFVLGLLLKNISFEWFRDFKVTNDIETLYSAYEVERFISVGEVGYRCILIMYGTLFPAYVLLMMVPPFFQAKINRPWWTLGITFLLSSITAYFGFVHDKAWGIGATLGIICLGRLWVDFKAYKKSRK